MLVVYRSSNKKANFVQSVLTNDVTLSTDLAPQLKLINNVLILYFRQYTSRLAFSRIRGFVREIRTNSLLRGQIRKR